MTPSVKEADRTSKKRNPNITAIVMEQYEHIRQEGPCNMFDFNCVQGVACSFGFFELADLEKEDYVYILSNYSRLMEEHGITV